VRLSLAICACSFIVSAWLILYAAATLGAPARWIAGIGWPACRRLCCLPWTRKDFLRNVLYPISTASIARRLRHWSSDALLAKLAYFGETVLVARRSTAALGCS
jgi:hypothetical protein